MVSTGAGFRLWNQRMHSSASINIKNTLITNLRFHWQRQSFMQNSITDVNSVMGVEGAAASVYFEAFGKMLRKELGFERRQRRPPKDPVNALLSLGYTLIGNEMHSMICAVGFDPYIGFFHGIDYGRPSLALDLIEPFRHAIIDRFTLYLVNNHILTEKDFDDKADEGVLLNDDARKRYFAEYEKYMTKETESNLSPAKKGFRDLFKIQAHNMHDVILGTGAFMPYQINA